MEVRTREVKEREEWERETNKGNRVSPFDASEKGGTCERDKKRRFVLCP
jgi:hypothetical protein